MTNRPYQVVMKRYDMDVITYVRYFSDFKTAYSDLRKHILHSCYSRGYVKYVGKGTRHIVFMGIYDDCCYRWFGKIRLFHADDIFFHHKPSYLCAKGENEFYV